MGTVATYLNFMGRTEEAFEFYRRVFRTSYVSEPVRMGSVPPQPGMPALSDADKQAIMHVGLPIVGGHLLMGTDVLESMGHTLNPGDNVSIMLQLDTRAEADDFFARLSPGATVTMPMADMFWGDYFGSLTDQFGIQWMLDVPGEPTSD